MTIKVKNRSSFLFLLLIALITPGIKPTQANESGSQFDQLSALQAGNQHFVDGKPGHPDESTARRHELATAQHPHTIVLSCSDSRVPPELIFDQGLGDLFVVRSAGHVVGKSDIGSIEYAVEHLHAKLIVVMGHESCGAVKAAIDTPPGKSTGSPNIDSIVAAIQPNIKGIKVAKDDQTFREPVKANVAATVKQLMRDSSIIREGIEKGELMIAQGIYSLSTGKVDFWDAGEIGTHSPSALEHSVPAKEQSSHH